MSKAVVVLSGGLDSTTLAYRTKAFGYEVYGISFDYGQRHKRELEFAAETMQEIGEDHKIVDLSQFRDLFAESGSSLVTDTDVPDGHYAEDSMKATVVPNRNLIMFNIAVGYAVSIGAECVAMGMHAGDHFVYPDCRPGVVVAAEALARQANEGFIDETFHFMTPYINVSKNEIARQAVEFGVPIDETWSCYKGGAIHCGTCGTCVERLEALHSQEVLNQFPDFEDPTQYEDTEFWKTAGR